MRRPLVVPVVDVSNPVQEEEVVHIPAREVNVPVRVLQEQPANLTVPEVAAHKAMQVVPAYSTRSKNGRNAVTDNPPIYPTS